MRRKELWKCNARIYLCGLILAAFTVYSQTDSSGFGRLGIFDVSLSADARLNQTSFRAGLYPDNTVIWSDPEYKQYVGGTVTIRQSFMALALLNYQQKKWRYGDWVHAELTVGHHNANFEAASYTPIFPLYAFELGGFASFAPSKQWDIGLAIALFRFTRDFMSERTPGSAYYLRAAYTRWLFEIGYITENKLYFGMFNSLVGGTDQIKTQCVAKYRTGKWHYVSASFFVFPLFKPMETPQGRERIWALKLGYGINF